MFRRGGFAEFACLEETESIVKPEGLSFADAATLPQAASVALQAIRDKGKTKAGSRVLINGAGGAVGSFAIQIAKSMKAEVTAVDVEPKKDFLLELGADHFIDYVNEDFTRTDNQYDFVLDVIGNRSLGDKRV